MVHYLNLDKTVYIVLDMMGSENYLISLNNNLTRLI